MLENAVHDVRYAIRTLRKSAGFTAIAIAILALGIGANTAIFSLVSAVLLKPLPFEQPDRLMLLWDDFSAASLPDRIQPSLADYADWKERSTSFEDMAAFFGQPYNLTGEGDPERLQGVRTTTNLFAILGLQPTLGRTFLPSDEGPDSEPVVVVSERLWARRFAADPDLVGRTIELDGIKRTVVGIVPPDFGFPARDTSVWVPASFTPQELAERTGYNYNVLARLKSDVAIDTARAEMNVIQRQIQEGLAGGNSRFQVNVTPLHEHLAREARPTLFVLLAAVGTVLLITCANVANLVLVRGANRQKELAIRKALGADNRRVLGQLAIENALIAAAGVVLGIGLSSLTFGYLARLMPLSFPDAAAPTLDWRVLAFTAALAVLTVLLFGAGPAVVAARRGYHDALKKSVGASAAPRAGRVRGALVVAEVACTVVLLAAAGLLLRSYAAVLAVDPGFRADHLLIAETVLSPTQYARKEDRAEFFRRVLERVSALPSVTSAGYTNIAPLLFKGGRILVTIDGRPPPTPEDFGRFIVSDRTVSGGYFATLGVPLLRGRTFDERDAADAPPSVMINESMARLHWPGEDPIGKRVKFGNASNDQPWLTVIGIVADVRQMGLEVPPDPELYFSLEQSPLDFPFLWPRNLLVRTEVDPMTLASALRSAIWEIDASQPVSSIRTMSEVLNAELASRDTQLTLVGAFAALALLLSAIGIYGVLSYTVAQRTAEIGVRIALGAQARSVLYAVVGRALTLGALGVALGLLAAFALTRFIGSFLYGVSPADPFTLAGVALALLAVTVAASFVPARRAASVDPVEALRSE